MKRIDVPAVDHIGVRVRDLDLAMKFYGMLGFELEHKAANDAVAVVRNAHGVELNLVYNANDDRGGKSCQETHDQPARRNRVPDILARLRLQQLWNL